MNKTSWKGCTQWEGQRNRQEMSQRRRCERYLTVCYLVWLGPVTSEELSEEVAHDRVCAAEFSAMSRFGLAVPSSSRFNELAIKSVKWNGKPKGAGIAQWLEHRTRDWKVAGSNPCWNGGRIFFSRVDFLCWLLFRYPFHPRVTTVARKNPGHSAKSAGGRLQLNTHTPYVCGFYWTVLRHWSQLVPNMSNDIWGH